MGPHPQAFSRAKDCNEATWSKTPKRAAWVRVKNGKERNVPNGKECGAQSWKIYVHSAVVQFSVHYIDIKAYIHSMWDKFLLHYIPLLHFSCFLVLLCKATEKAANYIVLIYYGMAPHNAVGWCSRIDVPNIVSSTICTSPWGPNNCCLKIYPRFFWEVSLFSRLWILQM